MDSASEISTATERLSESARKNWPGTPDEQAQRREHDDSGQRRAEERCQQLLHRVDHAAAALAGAPMDILHDDHRIVDDEADRDRQPAHRHQVDRAAEQPHESERRHDGHRQA